MRIKLKLFACNQYIMYTFDRCDKSCLPVHVAGLFDQGWRKLPGSGNFHVFYTLLPSRKIYHLSTILAKVANIPWLSAFTPANLGHTLPGRLMAAAGQQRQCADLIWTVCACLISLISTRKPSQWVMGSNSMLSFPAYTVSVWILLLFVWRESQHQAASSLVA